MSLHCLSGEHTLVPVGQEHYRTSSCCSPLTGGTRWLLGICCAALLFTLLLPSGLPAQQPQPEGPPTVMEPVVVTASRMAMPLSQVGKSISVLTEEEIDALHTTFSGDLLETLPSVRFTQLGGPGNFSTLNIRGASASHTLYLVNGLPMADPSSIAGDFSAFVSNLYLDDAERVEVLRGPQSTLYGADAVGGVVNIITRRGEGPPKVRVWGEGGSENTFREAVSVSGGSKTIFYALTAANASSDGLDEHDDFRDSTISGRFGIVARDVVSLDAFVRYLDSSLLFNDQDFLTLAITDDPDQQVETHSLVAGFIYSHDVLPFWRQRVAYQAVDSRREYTDQPDPGETVLDIYPGTFDGLTQNLELQGDLFLGTFLQSDHPLLDEHTLTLGFEHERQDADTVSLLFGTVTPFKRHQDSDAFFLQDQIGIAGRLFLTGGFRVTDYQVFGTETTGEGSAALVLPETGTKIKGNVSTGFDDPSLFQLFDPAFGNPDLEAAEVLGYDVGVEQGFLDGRAVLALTYFRNDFTNLFAFDPETFRTANVGDAEAEGFEVEANFQPASRVRLGANYTFTDSESSLTGGPVPLIPQSLVNAYLAWSPVPRLSVRVDANYVSENWAFALAELPKNKAHTTVDLVLSCRVGKRAEVYGRIDNLLDEEFEENGFPNPGIFVFGGIRAAIF